MPRKTPIDLTLIDKQVQTINGSCYYVYNYTYTGVNGQPKFKTVKRKYTPKKEKTLNKNASGNIKEYTLIDPSV